MIGRSPAAGGPRRIALAADDGGVSKPYEQGISAGGGILAESGRRQVAANRRQRARPGLHVPIQPADRHEIAARSVQTKEGFAMIAERATAAPFVGVPAAAVAAIGSTAPAASPLPPAAAPGAARLPRVVIVGAGFGGLAAATRAPARNGAADPDRPAQLPPVPAAALPGRDRSAVAGRHRAADPQHPAAPAECPRAARPGHRRRRRGARGACCRRGRAPRPVRLPDPRHRRAPRLFRP